MNVIETINKRHSYRGKYKSDTVPKEDLITIMKAGLSAPSGCNKQTTSLIAVDDKAILNKLHSVIDPPVGETAPAIRRNGSSHDLRTNAKNTRIQGKVFCGSGLFCRN